VTEPFVATYRLQLGPDLDLRQARELVPYLDDLGVSHLYLSPVMQARPGSTHGYDVVDPTTVSVDLGGEEALTALARAGLGLVLDIVPNHMAVDERNPFWTDERRRERFFDLDPVTGGHRRFFDVDELAGVRVEDPEVFETTHRTILRLAASGLVDGLRVDHIDGLADPAAYLGRLRDAGVGHVWVEKILERGETLRDWPVEGTTGYEFIGDVQGLLVDPAAEARFTELSGEARAFADVAHAAKLEQATTTFRPEVERLHRLVADRFGSGAVADALASLPVYRTYVEPAEGAVAEADRHAVAAVEPALRALLLLEGDHPARQEFVTRFQQTSGAIMAKGIEDTAFYRYVRFVALNEVGGDPGRFGASIRDFHAANRARARRFPRTLLAAQTHDTKRSADVRARLRALTAAPDQWSRLVTHWHETSAVLRDDGGAPDWTEELFVYQTLVGAWPITDERLEGYLVKAMREAKRNTNWIEPDHAWEEGVCRFARALRTFAPFLDTLEPFLADIADAGERSSLAEVALRFTSPGVPDIYRGDELWDHSLVDPDNRRPVDWDVRRDALATLLGGAPPTRDTAKLFAIHRLLALRRRRPDAFAGPYEPLDADERTCAYRRGAEVVVAVPTRSAAPEVPLPPGRWRNVLEELGDLYDGPLAVYELVTD
jgi:(1->4)-alpha-D-glucan 1-alpha-D-glucosylmutase